MHLGVQATVVHADALSVRLRVAMQYVLPATALAFVVQDTLF
jgi:hypothetical protein